MKRRLLVILILLVVVCSAVCCAKKKPSPGRDVLKNSEEAAFEAPDQGIAQKILSFNLEGYRDNGQKKWELNGACANILSNVIKLDYITAKAYGDDGSLTIKARRGIYDKATKDIDLEKNVVGKASDGTRLITDKLHWDDKTECVTTDSVVRIERENLVSVGKGAVGNPGLKKVELKKDVVVELRDNPPTLITCNGPLVVNYNKNISILNNNVKISDERGEICSDIMKVTFNPGTRKILRVVAIGNVKITREGNSTYSDRAVYSVKDGRVRLIGKPKIIVFPKEGKEAKGNAPVRDEVLN